MRTLNLKNLNNYGKIFSVIMLTAVILAAFSSVFLDISDDDLIFTFSTQDYAIYALYFSYLFIISAVFVLSTYTEFIHGRAPPLFL